LDDPRLLLSEPFRAVHFVFGLYYPEDRALSGRALLGSLAALGYGDEAARGILLRLRRGGFLTSTRAGRTAAYALSPRSLALVGEISRRAALAPPRWTGTASVLIVQVPPAERAFREQLRRHAAYAGLGAPSPGLLLATEPAAVEALEPLLSHAPAGVSVVRGTLSLSLEDARRLAGAAWRLEPLAARLREEATRMELAAEEAASAPPSGSAALAFLWRSIGPFFELLSEGRPLPTELLPGDWPLADANRSFVKVAMLAAPPAIEYVERLDAAR
jgi:phenylacetic acid degradation operon negative regulatory protein